MCVLKPLEQVANALDHGTRAEFQFSMAAARAAPIPDSLRMTN
jgi:hypothetical protein